MSANPSRQLAPWEEVVYFNAPKWSQVTTTPAAWTPLCAANPQRVCVVFQGTTGQTFLTTDTSLPGITGINVSLNVPSLILTEADHASLCTAAWYGRGSSGTVVSIVEVILRQMPEC